MRCPHCNNEDGFTRISRDEVECNVCAGEFHAPLPARLTRNERLQLAADAGFDTWEDYRGER